MEQNKVRRLVLMGMFVALSFVGSNIKIFSSIAFDSFPAYLAGLLMGGLPGGIVGFIGHLMTSGLSGFPFGLPIHLAIAVMMFAAVFIMKWLADKTHIIVGVIVAILVNGVVMPCTLVIMPGFTWPLALAFMPMLVMVSAANVLLAAAVHVILMKSGAVSEMENADL